MGALLITLAILLGITFAILAIIFIAVPLLKGLAYGIGYTFGGIGWLIAHLFEFIAGMLGDSIRLIGAIIAIVILTPFAPLNVIIGRWSAASHFAQSVKREFQVAAACVYRFFLRRPLKLFWLHGLLEGVEQRVPEAMHAAPQSDTPSRRTGTFDGYTIVGSLRGGGSGAKLYIAEPDEKKKKRGMPDRVVIKSFAITEGSSLPQIVRESRALECAKQLGHVLEHDLDDTRFYYVMPYHAGDHLGVITRQMHGASDGQGINDAQLRKIFGYTTDLLSMLSAYHRGGLWHKDVKPENIIIHDGRAHLVDLGLVTPLRSAMTLTTHGTEYFRDPEMVRQALRGVKVHQVDGAKFDIYAVGAVLYFVLENTFPAHGGLSKHIKRSPEAVRWIVRRAMADYNQRYETADAMLEDVQSVLAADDPYAVRPVDLPSMRDSNDAPAEIDPPVAVESVAKVGSPIPPKTNAEPDETVEGFGVAAGIGSRGPFTQAGKFKIDQDGNPVATGAKSKTGGPKLRVTDWWTGSYVVEGSDAQKPPHTPSPSEQDRAEIREFRRQAAELRADAESFRANVTAGPVSPRRAAREQLRNARQRAREMQKRVRTRRAGLSRSGNHRQFQTSRDRKPPVFLGFLCLLVLAGVILVGFGVFSINETSNTSSQVFTDSSVGVFNNSAEAYASAIADDTSVNVTLDPGPALLMVPDPDIPNTKAVRLELMHIADRYIQQHQDVIIEPKLTAPMHDLLMAWDKAGQTTGSAADEFLEDMLEANDLFGVIRIIAHPGYGAVYERLEDKLIYSSRSGAEQRRWTDMNLLIDDPMLLINDHFANHDPKVIKRVQSHLDRMRSRGVEIQTNTEAEAAVRVHLPAGEAAIDGSVSPLLHQVLAKYGFGSVMLVTAIPGDGEPEDRIAFRTIIRSIDEDTTTTASTVSLPATLPVVESADD